MSKPLDDDAQEAVTRLITLIGFDDGALIEKHLALFEEAMEDADDDVEGQELLWLIKDVIDWESGFYVDWKDTGAFVSCMDQLCARLDIELDWGVDDPEDEDFLESTSVPELMEQACEQLRAAGITDADAYGGWLARSVDDEEMLAIAETLNLEIRPGDQPY
jgi:hypothetical protein